MMARKQTRLLVDANDLRTFDGGELARRCEKTYRAGPPVCRAGRGAGVDAPPRQAAAFANGVPGTI